MKNMNLTSRKLLCVRIAIILALSALLVEMRDQYVGSQHKLATQESLSKICDQINEVGQYDQLLHDLGQQEGLEAKQRLCMLLSGRIHSLKQALESADEDVRDFGNIALERFASHQRQHPDYYAYSPANPDSQ